MATRTFTIDAASQPWVYPDGLATVVTTNETFTLELTDTGNGGVYAGLAGTKIGLADGEKLRFEGDRAMTFIAHEANGAVLNSGDIWVYTDDYDRTPVHVVTATITDGDGTGANNLASITFEYPGLPYRWTWANINMA